MTRYRTVLKTAAAAFILSTAAGSLPAAAEGLLFWSTQARPVEEAQAMREQVLSGFGSEVDYQPQDPGPYITRLQAELEAGDGTIDVLGGLHGDFTAVGDGLVDLSDVDIGGVKVTEAFMDLATLGGDGLKYIPWMQATYVMAANKKALEFLPEGANVMALTYDELIAWAAAMGEATGSPKFGMPAGPKGLKHRFIQGYLYPSFTDSMVTKFRSDEAEAMWNTMKELWAHTNPASTNYAFMQEPLLSEEVWVAFDHTARLAEAFNQRPDDFIAFPAPAGPTGRGFMPVVAGVAIPTTSPDMESAKALVSYMMKPETQVATLRATNFFPVIDVELPDDMPDAVRISAEAITAQSNAEDANPGLLPVGLGELGGKFSQVYSDTFERIILAGQDVRAVLDEQAEALKAVMDEAGAPCWAPDEPSEGACPVE